MNPKIKVAIIIANYNTAHFVLDAIKSALAQDYSHKGIFIVDDCSTDNSREVIGNFFPNMESLEQNEHYTLFQDWNSSVPVYLFALNKNVGRGQVRNFPIAYALNNGYHLIQILDSDDMMKPSKITELSKVMLEDPEHIAITYADYIILNENGVSHYESKKSFEYLRFFNGEDCIHSGALISGAHLAKVGLYPDQPCVEDYHLFRRLLKNAMAIHIAKSLTVVRSHSQDSTQSLKKEEWDYCFRKTMMET